MKNRVVTYKGCAIQRSNTASHYLALDRNSRQRRNNFTGPRLYYCSKLIC